jgi:hypothetical protein
MGAKVEIEFGHGFLPRADARNYKAVERCLPTDGPNLFHEGLDLGWAVLEGPWAIQHGDATVQMCKERQVSFFVGTQAWRYWDERTFVTEKFTAVPYAPRRPLPDCNRDELHSFVAACLVTQDHLGATAFLLPGLVPKSAIHEVHDQALGACLSSRH